MKRTRIPCILAVLLLSASCGDGADPPADDSDSARPDLPHRAELREDTLVIEGVPEPALLRLVRAPDPVAAPFTTYVPEGIDTEFEEGGDSAGVRFTAAFAGMREPNAYMHVRLYPPGERPDPHEAASAFLRTRRPQDHPVDGGEVDEPYEQVEPPAWGDVAYAFQYRGEGGAHFVGRIVLARHGARQFHVLTHYPAEYGDGLGPRFERILAEWRWEDDGEMLTAAATAPPREPGSP
jgi:hypothetical protein